MKCSASDCEEGADKPILIPRTPRQKQEFDVIAGLRKYHYDRFEELSKTCGCIEYAMLTMVKKHTSKAEVVEDTRSFQISAHYLIENVKRDVGGCGYDTANRLME